MREENVLKYSDIADHFSFNYMPEIIDSEFNGIIFDYGLNILIYY